MLCSGWSAGVIGGSPCSPELMKDIVFTLGIKEIIVSLHFNDNNNNNVIVKIMAKLLKIGS